MAKIEWRDSHGPDGESVFLPEYRLDLESACEEISATLRPAGIQCTGFMITSYRHPGNVHVPLITVFYTKPNGEECSYSMGFPPSSSDLKKPPTKARIVSGLSDAVAIDAQR